MSKGRWFVVLMAMFLSIGLDFVSATLSVAADAALIGVALYFLWPALTSDIRD